MAMQQAGLPAALAAGCCSRPPLQATSANACARRFAVPVARRSWGGITGAAMVTATPAGAAGRLALALNLRPAVAGT